MATNTSLSSARARPTTGIPGYCAAIAIPGTRQELSAISAATLSHDGERRGWQRDCSIGANLTDIWVIANTGGSKDEHYASFPKELPRRAIVVGTSDKGYCAKCGAPWWRKIEKSVKVVKNDAVLTHLQEERLEADIQQWEPSCKCKAPLVRATVLDPFSGSGTTSLTAAEEYRHSIAIDLKPAYNAIAIRRLERSRGMSEWHIRNQLPAQFHRGPRIRNRNS